MNESFGMFLKYASSYSQQYYKSLGTAEEKDFN